ncbi:MAG: NAD(P)H-dependent oxidoreductase subunit E [Proteobacteria bacterium]|nr:NAD(P)H-dependent oxidoreductase subunit E [Pseudomonadota bacterium]
MTMPTIQNTDNWNEIQKASREELPPSVVAFIEDCMKSEVPSSMLIAVLHKLQGELGYLGKEKIDAVAQLMQIPTATVAGVATFYHFFQLHPPGKFRIHICMGTACYVKGADKVATEFKDALGTDMGHTSKHGTFSLQEAACLGTCGLAPVVTINDEVNARVSADDVPRIIKKCRESLVPTEETEN